MPPVAQCFGEWMDSDGPTIQVDCLLPTGIIIPMVVDKDSTIDDIKEELWKEAQAYPLYDALKSKHTYVFQCITSMAEKVELEDERQRLQDVKPFQPILKVVERKGNKLEKIMNLHITMLIGKGLHEFDNLKSTEVSDFRQSMRKVCERISRERDAKEWHDRVTFLYPPDLSDTVAFPDHIREKLTNKKLIITVHMADRHEKDESSYYKFQVPCTTISAELIQMVIQKRHTKTGVHLGEYENFVLKVCGREELLMGGYPMSQFMYIRRCVTKDITPSVLLMEKTAIDKEIEAMQKFQLADKPPNPKPTLPPKSPNKPKVTTSKPYRALKGTSLWDVQEKFSFRLHGATNISESDFSKLQLSACIFHGPDAMSSVEKSRETMISEGCASWEDDLTFDINMTDIPRMARLCFILSSIGDKRVKGKRTGTGGKRKGGHPKENTNVVAWVNITLFDYKAILRTGAWTLYMWPVSDDDTLSDRDALLNPIGTVGNNPISGGAVCLKITFHDFNVPPPIHYPPFEKVLEVAAQHTDFSNVDNGDFDSAEDTIQRHVSTIMLDERKNVNQKHLEQLRLIVDRDPLAQLHDQDIQQIWRLRFECQYHFPHSLPKLLRCVKWNNHLDVAQMQALLQIWPTLSPDQALELLDFYYADETVRSYAVKCLKKEISDQQLKQYLLQLVQVLKYESYLECDLVNFLVERALNNHRIGHSLFWLLRSEMHVQSISVRFGLILEAYCRGSYNHISALSKQTMALDKFKFLSKSAKDEKSKETAVKNLRERLKEPAFKEAMTDLPCTLDPAYKLGCPVPAGCNVMDSKMRPLWLQFENKDQYGEKVHIMYKHGDDLRQDMLTLQILRIIDNIWQEAGLDLRLNAYGCLSTGQMEGLIEVVTGSNTISNIQKKYPGLKLKSAFNKESLYMWLKGYNNTPEKLEKAMNEFTMSCAGYSVAMYVLGVADRHGDNILLKEDGQLFHIDFGHFLGKFKEKFGMNREPAKLLLTSDIVYMIQRGPAKDNKAFERFKKTCEKAYMALREKSNFLITLFLMMMNTGIPELSGEKDIEYLKQTLKPDLTEGEAREHFRKQINIALKNAWKVSVQNTFHNMRRDNN